MKLLLMLSILFLSGCFSNKESMPKMSSATLKVSQLPPPTLTEVSSNFKELLKQPRSTYLGKAEVCKKVAEYYKRYAKEYSTVYLGGGDAGTVSMKLVSKLSLPTDFKDVPDEELEAINLCYFNRFYMETTFTTNTRNRVLTLNTDKYFYGTATIANLGQQVLFTQKLAQSAYLVNLLKVNLSLKQKTFSDGASILFKTEKNWTQGLGYIFGVYSGTETVTMNSGFGKRIPALLDVSADGASAIYVRFEQIRDYLYSKYGDKKPKCVQRFLADNGFEFIQLGCYPRDEKRIEPASELSR